MLVDANVRRWHDNLARGSARTAAGYLGKLGRFLEEHALSTKQLVKMAARKRDDLLADHVSRMTKAGRAPAYIKGVKQSVVSFLIWNGVPAPRKVKIPNIGYRPTLRNAYIPSQDELRRVLHASDARSRTAIALMAYGGVRPQVLGNYAGTDGLRLGDIPEASVKDGSLVFQNVPARIMVRRELSKTKNTYFTFLGREGCEYLAACMKERLQLGETITADSPILTPRKVDKPFIRTGNISDIIRRPMKAAGVKLPPYIWRSYFASRAMNAESEGFLRDYRVFMMGHQGDIEHVYALQKQLPQDTVERMRKGYAAALPYLESAFASKPEDARLKVAEVLLQVAGYSSQEVDAMALADKPQSDVMALLRKVPAGSGPGKRQRVVTMEELGPALGGGWTFKATLPDGRAVVEAHA